MNVIYVRSNRRLFFFGRIKTLLQIHGIKPALFQRNVLSEGQLKLAHQFIHIQKLNIEFDLDVQLEVFEEVNHAGKIDFRLTSRIENRCERWMDVNASNLVSAWRKTSCNQQKKEKIFLIRKSVHYSMKSFNRLSLTDAILCSLTWTFDGQYTWRPHWAYVFLGWFFPSFFFSLLDLYLKGKTA